MISYIASATVSDTAPHFLLGSVELPVPVGSLIGDVLVACAVIPSAEFASSGSSGRFYRLQADGWQVLELVEFRQGDNKAVLLSCYRVLNSVPTSFTITVTREVIGVADAIDDISVFAAASCYRGVDNGNPIQAHDAAKSDDGIALVVIRPTATIISATYGVNVTDALTERVTVGDLRVAEDSVAVQGRTAPYTLTSDSDDLGRVVLALNPFVAAPGIDPPPTAGTGVGKLITDINNPLVAQAYRVTGSTLSEVATPRLLAVDAAFDAIGGCVGGLATFTSDPLWQPYTRLLRVSYTTTASSPVLWFSGVCTTITDVDGLFDVELLPLSDLWLDDAVALADYPSHVTISERLNLNSGLVVDRLAGTVDEWQTWRTYLKKRFEGVSEVTYGVGAEGRYIQGRPQDAVPLVLDARRYPDSQPKGINLTPYVSAWFGTPTDTTDPVTSSAERDDLPALAPRRVEPADEGGSGYIAPDGFGLPFSEPSSYVINIPDALVIPPLQVVDLPNGETQYVAGSRVKIEVDSGGGASLMSSIRTRTIPYAGTRQRDRLGRFV